jgi:hypothetical protein
MVRFGLSYFKELKMNKLEISRDALTSKALINTNHFKLYCALKYIDINYGNDDKEWTFIDITDPIFIDMIPFNRLPVRTMLNRMHNFGILDYNLSENKLEFKFLMGY